MERLGKDSSNQTSYATIKIPVTVVLPEAYTMSYVIMVTSRDTVKWDAGSNFTFSEHSGATENRTLTGFVICWNCGGRNWLTIGY